MRTVNLLGTMFRFILAISLALVACAEESAITDEFRKWAAAKETEWQADSGQTNSLRLPGLRASKSLETVELLVAATGVAAGAPIEYLMVSPEGKQYEAISVCLAKPSDIDQALRFIGMSPGRPTNAQAFQFWPIGPRLRMRVSGAESTKWAPLSQYVWDSVNDRELAVMDAHFVGSLRKDGYAADRMGDVASTFNSPWTVLDTPFRFEQNAVYNRFVAHPERVLAHGTALIVELAPVERAMERMVVVNLAIQPGEDAGAAELARWVVTRGGTVLHDGAFQGFLGWLKTQADQRCDVHLAVHYDDSLPLAVAVAVSPLIKRLADEGLIRPEPAVGQLYFEAFITQDKWRARENRDVPPIELHLTAIEPKLVGRFEHLEDIYEDAGRRQALISWQFEGEAGLTECLKRRDRWWTSNVFVFANSGTSVGVVNRLCHEVAEATPVAFIFETKE